MSSRVPSPIISNVLGGILELSAPVTASICTPCRGSQHMLTLTSALEDRLPRVREAVRLSNTTIRPADSGFMWRE